MLLDSCKKGKHSLQVIYRSSQLFEEEKVIRWCSVCGAIVIDNEIDGKRICSSMKLKCPTLAIIASRENSY